MLSRLGASTTCVRASSIRPDCRPMPTRFPRLSARFSAVVRATSCGFSRENSRSWIASCRNLTITRPGVSRRGIGLATAPEDAIVSIVKSMLIVRHFTRPPDKYELNRMRMTPNFSQSGKCAVDFRCETPCLQSFSTTSAVAQTDYLWLPRDFGVPLTSDAQPLDSSSRTSRGTIQEQNAPLTRRTCGTGILALRTAARIFTLLRQMNAKARCASTHSCLRKKTCSSPDSPYRRCTCRHSPTANSISRPNPRNRRTAAGHRFRHRQKLPCARRIHRSTSRPSAAHEWHRAGSGKTGIPRRSESCKDCLTRPTNTQ